MTQQSLPLDDSPIPVETRDDAGRLLCRNHRLPIRATGAACVECWRVAVGAFGPTWREGAERAYAWDANNT